MVIGTISFIISWVTFYLFSNKKKFPLFVSTVYLGIIFSFITDLLMFVYPLWNYPGTKLETFSIQLLNGFGIYFVVIYLFLQSLPKKQTILLVTRHIFYWSVFCILLELMYIYIGFIEHGLWWNIGLSYVADWILFVIFYLHHRWLSNYSTLAAHNNLGGQICKRVGKRL
ncbi:CBO0543 family protein [Ornithinibacillus scapharcae]|uniref:CBO0543 family protein n=1 Tax=Ornithinibacillus scapharcae TaxID=1147159 RepID=UPI000225B81D